MENTEDKKNTYQAIVVLKNVSGNEAELVTAGMTVLHQFNSRSNSYVGQYEATEFTKHWDSWVKDNCLKQRIFFADTNEDMNELSYLAELEKVPQSAFDDESTVLVLGPFSEDRLNYLTQNLEEKN